MTPNEVRVCDACETPGVLTPTGHCPGCAIEACAWGAGEDVGLPVPADLGAALDALIAHVGCRTPDCLVCAVAEQSCSECDQHVDDFDADQLADHVVVGAWVAVGCEDFVTAALRAVAL